MTRPLGIVLLTMLAVVGAAASFLIAAGALAADDLLNGVVGLVTGAVMLAFAFGAWTARPWAWPLGLGIFGLSVLNALFATISGQSLLGPIIIGVLAIAFLLQGSTRQYFSRASA